MVCELQCLVIKSTVYFAILFSDTRSGILRVWNVSMSKPIETIKVKKTGIHALQAISTNIVKSKDNREGHISSTSAADSPALVNQAHFAVPPAQILCTFHDGGIGLYDLSLRNWKFLREEVLIVHFMYYHMFFLVFPLVSPLKLFEQLQMTCNEMIICGHPPD